MKSYKNYNGLYGLIIASSISLTACDPLVSKLHFGTELGVRIPIEELPEDELGKQTDPENQGEEIKFSQLGNETEKADEKKLEKQIYTGTGQFVSKKSRKNRQRKGTEGKYSLNFDGADLGEVTKIILTDMLQENYVLSPRVGGTVTLQTTNPLRRDELIPTLEMLLRINGAVLVKKDGLYRIEADANGLQLADSANIADKKLRTGYQIKVIPLKYVGAADMAEIIIPVLPPKAITKVDPIRNILMVAGTKSEIGKILDLVNTFDVNFLSGMSFGLFPLENTDVDSTLGELEKIFNEGAKTPLSGMLRFVSIKHLNAILVISQQKAYLKEAEHWISRLDVEITGAGEGGVVVYNVQHVKAVELAATLNEVISGVASSKKPASVAPGQKLSSISNRKSRSKTKNSRKGSQGSSSLEGVNIIADEANNALIIVAQPQQFRMVNKIIKKLDIMPLQVLIDATIISVNLTDNLEYGVKWAFKNALSSDRTTGVGLFGTGAPDIGLAGAAASAAIGGFSYGIVQNDGQIKMAVNILAENGKTDVISSPSVLVLNNHEATLKVGDQVPIRTSQSTNIDGNANFQTSPIEMVDTGVTLTVKPRVNANGVVIMEIEQKVDNISTSGKGSLIDSPAILQRQIKSTVAVVSGESVVLGGLMNETQNDKNNGIPILKDIPYIGWLFGKQTKSIEKQELIVVITPKVIANRVDAKKVTNEFKRKLSGIYYDKGNFNRNYNQVLRDGSGHEIKTDQFYP